jgi:hypothetical protein
MFSGIEIGVKVFSKHWFCDLFPNEIVYAVDDSAIYYYKHDISLRFQMPLSTVLVSLKHSQSFFCLIKFESI